MSEESNPQSGSHGFGTGRFLPSPRQAPGLGWHADRRVRVWDLTTEPAVKMFDQPCDIVRKFGTACTAAFSPDGRLLATGCKGILASGAGEAVKRAARFARSRNDLD